MEINILGDGEYFETVLSGGNYETSGNGTLFNTKPLIIEIRPTEKLIKLLKKLENLSKEVEK
jgi:hypothetical protein